MLVNLVAWLTDAGQQVAGANYYVPLPPAIQGLAQATLKEVTGPAGNVLLP